ncbi:hypothetical protein PtA15_3A106 [Puccinia triticina]|uniref:Uncharacterized protein n=1 Tax=Puccinia triticina TaxID=208348 RepID=A0ABY7CFM5_9BASI|nr:uncharacterized protein PtA15_3A106 [Puccinia triticina]WAQ82742.1 hypothetical protein PtA15_3A106 [Puccinia triticina]
MVWHHPKPAGLAILSAHQHIQLHIHPFHFIPPHHDKESKDQETSTTTSFDQRKGFN